MLFTQVNVSEIDTDGGFCYLKSNTIPVRSPLAPLCLFYTIAAAQQCGLKMRYCCEMNATYGGSVPLNLVGESRESFENMNGNEEIVGEKSGEPQAPDNRVHNRRVSACFISFLGIQVPHSCNRRTWQEYCAVVSLLSLLLLHCIRFGIRHRTRKKAVSSFVTMIDAMADPISPSNIIQDAIGPSTWSTVYSCSHFYKRFRRSNRNNRFQGVKAMKGS